MPPGALSSQDIEAGVRATTQEFFDDLNTAIATGDVSKITALTAPACGCRSIVQTIQQTYAQHERFQGVVATLQSQNVVTFLPSGATVDLHFSITAGVVVDADGKQVNTSIGAPAAHSAMFIAREANGWRVQQNTILSSGAK
ncbi:MAG TPA: DUF6318 family protein [Acidothermaceae bacterium]